VVNNSAMRVPTADADPLAVFEAWYEEAVRSGAPFPEGMALATATPDGRPSVRVVLYKGTSEGGVLFFTNYESRKGRELEQNPRAAVVFHWPALGRQVRMEGRVERIARSASEAYFATRPRDSQLGAWASPQSRTIASRKELDDKLLELEERSRAAPVACPECWGGYRLVPDEIELWINREGRLHDRLLYRRHGSGWQLVLLAP
jgi:pyridoxamine 5'-phosphate oxidase